LGTKEQLEQLGGGKGKEIEMRYIKWVRWFFSKKRINTVNKGRQKEGRGKRGS